ncbi:hypothetical protein AU210_011037 [Fusarium oxysporum f. sp. radicis-cucumerinum]|uniref:SnoaL-like domain-containing protein n=1 Tax=Fusarium oxysporum f. sp. radicis-cucumerinum TaxID=327505 RepID=A0A2H3H4Q3_FUSOX|nr:hypothetical protein AU210_011037 [Fusarium oxysporum f. sp. radicis-cucumerinum]
MVPFALLTALAYLSVLASSTPRQNQFATHSTSDNHANLLEYSISDERKFRDLSYRWTHAWDQKDKATWLAITAPEVIANYTDYPAVGTLTISSPAMHTQHFLGSSLFTHISKSEAKGDWQVRARHVREVNGEERQWDSSAYVEFTYSLIDGDWKISGLRPHTVVATTGRPEDVIGLFP